MKKLHYILIPTILLVILIAGLYIYKTSFGDNNSSNNNNQQNNIKKIASKSLEEYKQIWADTFIHYQTNVSNFPEFGTYLFESSIGYTGETSQLQEFENLYKFGEGFKTIGATIGGDYDISNIENLALDLKFKGFLNKLTKGDGDINIDFRFDGKEKIKYRYNTMDDKFLTVLGLSGDQIRIILDEFKEKKSQWILSPIGSEILEPIVNTIRKQSENSPLYQNTAEEESAIIDSFVNREVIKVTKGESYENFDRIYFLLDTNALTLFAKDIAIALNLTGAENMSFDKDKEMLEKLYLGGFIDISNKIIIDSNIVMELPLIAIQNGNTVSEILALKTKLKFPDPGKLNFEMANSLRNITNNSTNKLTIILKGKIK